MFKKIIVRCERALTSIAILLVRLYQALLSPFLGGRCRFYPTCSDYAREALTEKGFLLGSRLTLRRLFKCHPFGKKGFDPVPKSFSKR
jgi:putative membrane protein insertion efficiency factor